MTGQAGTLHNLWTALGAPSDIDWEAVYSDLLPRVYNFLRYRVVDEATAQDLTSATFEKAWRNRARYRRDKAGFSTWLFTIARNLATDHLRALRDTVPLDFTVLASREPGPEQVAEHNQDLARLGQLLADLDERERELMALKFGADLSNREVARLMGLTESNVGTIAQRTVARMRARWAAGP